MSFSVPILARDQIQQVRSLVHGILEENKRIIDDILGELVDMQSTNILGLYNLVVEQWQKKQKIIDNLCHFSLTLMATVQLLWDQKYQNDELLAQAHANIDGLQRQNKQLKLLKDQLDQKVNELNTSSIKNDKLNEELPKSQSCVNFREQNEQSPPIAKKCESFSGRQNQKDDNLSDMKLQSEVESLKEEKCRLEKELQSAIEQSQMTKIELQLAEIAIKDALIYKNSYLSLMQNSRISQKSRSLENIDYINGEIECQSHIDDSFTRDARHFFPIEHIQDYNIHVQQSKGPDNTKKDSNSFQPTIQSVANPFKKKIFNSLQSRLKQQEEKRHQMDPSDESDFSSDDDQVDDGLNEFEAYRPRSQIINQRKVNQMISRFKLKKSKISDKQQTTQEESFFGEDSLFRPSSTNLIQKKKSKSPPQENSMSKLYSFFTNKVVRNRIRHK